jgi:hypothetical protein
MLALNIATLSEVFQDIEASGDLGLNERFRYPEFPFALVRRLELSAS